MLTELFPLNAEVWGTVSDWVMIVVTAVTAYFLYKTLNSQSLVQKAQQRITDIEEHQHLKRIQPNFDLHFFTDKRTFEPTGVKLIFHLRFENIGETAKDVKIDCITSKELLNVDFPITGDIVQRGDELYAVAIETFIPFEDSYKTEKIAFAYLGFNLKFTDKEKNRYEQHLSQFIGSEDHQPTKQPPFTI